MFQSLHNEITHSALKYCHLPQRPSMDKLVSAKETCKDGRNLNDRAQAGQAAAPEPTAVSTAHAGQVTPSLLAVPRQTADTPGYAVTHRHDELLNAVRGHTVQVSEVQLQVDLVVEHVLAERAAEHGLHRVLGHGVHPQPIHICVTVLAVWTLVHLQSRKRIVQLLQLSFFLTARL